MVRLLPALTVIGCAVMKLLIWVISESIWTEGTVDTADWGDLRTDSISYHTSSPRLLDRLPSWDCSEAPQVEFISSAWTGMESEKT